MLWYDSLFCIYTGTGDIKTRKLNKMKNNIQFINVFSRKMLDALERYKFNNLPDTVSERVVKQSLFWHGNVVFFEKEGNIIALPGGGTENFNIYGDPNSAYVYGRNGFNEQVKLYLPGADDAGFLRKDLSGKTKPQYYKGVMVYENYNRTPFVNYTMEFSSSIADAYRTLDVMRVNLKSPFIVAAEESLVPTVKRFFNERNDNAEYVVSSGKFTVDKINVIPIETNEASIKNVTDLIEWYENKYRELCGFDSNSNPDKKERLLVDEVNSNNDYVFIQSEKSMECLRYYMDQVNEVFRTNITVEKITNPEGGEAYDEPDIFGISGKEPESL